MSSAPERAALERGLQLFNQRRFFDAHEAWEEAWRTAGGPLRELLQGLIQVAAAFVKWERGEHAGCRRLLERAIGRLSAVEDDEAFGLDLAPLLEALVSFHRRRGEEMSAPGPPPPLLGYRPPEAAPVGGGGLSIFRPARCPYCGERVELPVEAVGSSAESFVQDCPVCCRPWTVQVTREGEEVDVFLRRDDD